VAAWCTFGFWCFSLKTDCLSGSLKIQRKSFLSVAWFSHCNTLAGGCEGCGKKQQAGEKEQHFPGL
jgi:hypothetical protein